MHEYIEYHDGENPIKKFVIRAGTIRCAAYNDHQYYKEDMQDFFSQLSEVGAMFGLIEKDISFEVVNLSSSSTGYRPGIKIHLPYDGVFSIGTSASNTIFPASTTTSPRPMYWMMYQSKNGDIGVSFAVCNGSYNTRDIIVNSDGTISNQVAINDRIESMSLWNPLCFCIVDVLNSLTNTKEKGIVVCGGINMIWQNDNTKEVGKRLSGNLLAPNIRGSRFYVNDPTLYPGGTSGPGTSRTVSNSVLLTADTPYYPRLKTTNNSALKNGLYSDIAPMVFSVPMWSPSSCCICESLYTIMWGDNLPIFTNEAWHADYYFCGPFLTKYGSQYYLRCGDILMPVDYTDTDPEASDDQEDEDT